MVRAKMVMSRGNYDASESESEAAPAANDSDESSPPELPSDDDSDYGKPKKKSSKKKTVSKSKKKASGGAGKKKKATPRGKISPAKTPASRAKKYNYASDDGQEEEDDEEDYMPAKGSKKKNPAKRSIDFDEYSNTPKGKKGGKRKAPAAASASRSSGRSPAAKKAVKYNEDSDDEEEEEEEEEQYYQPPIKKGRKSAASSSKKAPASKKKSSNKKGPKNKASKYYDPSESEVEEDESESEDDDEPVYQPKKGAYLQSKYARKQPPKPKLPPVSEMVIESIKALKDPPKKGSTLRSIKETIEMNWPIDLKRYNDKIKKYIINAVETGELIRTKGKGANGKFTVPGLKIKRKKKKNKLTKALDVDEVEYKPAETERSKAKEETQAELDRQREERRILEERKQEEKANKPKKPAPARKVEYEVEKITGVRERKDGDVEYLVKWVGYTKPTWESEDNVQDCQDLIDAYMIVKQKKDREKEEFIRKVEAEGNYEVAKIISFKQNKINKKRDFLVRWKGWGPEGDTWEPEDNLDCPDLIDKFMADWENQTQLNRKELRIAPKKIERLEYASNSRQAKRTGGFRINYADMDGDDYFDGDWKRQFYK